MAVGSTNLALIMYFDTGSAGVTLNAELVFPPALVDAGGFKFNGKDSINYQGITVINLTVQKVYGTNSKDTTIETGNIGFAMLTVGDANGSVKTQRMPVLFFYKTTRNSSMVTGPSICGVNVSDNKAPVLNISSKGFYLISPFKYLTYSNNVSIP
jgi:hypothetical protein